VALEDHVQIPAKADREITSPAFRRFDSGTYRRMPILGLNMSGIFLSVHAGTQTFIKL
jgi:hypothetical protein